MVLDKSLECFEGQKSVRIFFFFFLLYFSVALDGSSIFSGLSFICRPHLVLKCEGSLISWSFKLITDVLW